MKYTKRLYLGFGLMILVVTVLLAIIVSMFNSQNEEIDRLVEDRYEKIKLLNHIRVNIKNVDRDLNEYVQPNHEKEEPLQKIRESTKVVEKDMNVLADIIKVKDAREQLSNIDFQIDTYMDTIDRIISFVMVEEYEEASALYVTSLQQYEGIIETSEQLISIQERIMEETLESTEHYYNLYVKVSLIAIFGTLLIGFGISFWVIRSIKSRFQTIRDVMSSIQYGSVELPRIKVLANDEIGQIAQAYNEMAIALEEHERSEREYTQEIEAQNWLSRKLAKLSLLSQGIIDINILGEKFLQEAVPMVDGQYGALYIVKQNEYDEAMYLSKVSTYAGASQTPLLSNKADIQLGEGLVGQCAKDGKPKLIQQVPPNYLAISSALGKTEPYAILILPVVLDDDIVGVLEVASLSGFSELNQKLLVEANHQLGIAIYRITQQMKVRELLEESQTLNEELQSQSEELQVQQEELQTVNEELEAQYKHSEQRTKDLEAIRLALEEKTRQLQLNSNYKSEFLANMSHELRTPLNSLLILAQVLLENKENNLTEKQKEYAETIFEAGRDLLNLINEILDLAKIESGKLDMQVEKMDLTELIALTKNQFSILAEKKKIDFQVEVEDNVPHSIETDKQKVFQILKNLLSNAIKFTEEGYVKLKVRKEWGHSESLGYLVFQVMDTGIGITAEQRDYIFDAFQQADGTTSRKYGGTGLGLSISKELTHMLNGRITVESTEGEGSIFSLYLPIETSSKEEVAITKNDIQPQIVETSHRLEKLKFDQDLAEKTILIVDDDMRNIFSLTTALEAAGMKVYFAENGKEGIELLKSHQDIEIVLMDIMMPEMDGYEAMRRIRQMDDYNELPIIALTAKAMSHDRKKCMEAGASDYITKPVKLEQLFSLLKVWLYK